MTVPSLATTVSDLLVEAIRTAVPGAGAVDPQVRPSQHADLQANGVLGLARQLGRDPRGLAAEVAGAVDATGAVRHCEVAGPGFLNLTVHDHTLLEQVRRRLAHPRLGLGQPEAGVTTVIDYSNPNVAKHMHVGHLRSTVIGDALVRMLEHLGGTVVRQNHIGDWGTQFGMLVQFLVEHPEPAGAGVDRLAERYLAANAAFDTDPEFADRARQRVVALQSGDAGTVAVWRRLVAESTRAFTEVYRQLGVRLTEADVVGESFYNPRLPELVDELAAAGVAQPSAGAWCVFLPGELGRDGAPLPLIVRKRDGGFGYAATDLAALRHRVGTLRADRVLYVVDARQSQHLRMVFATAARAGWLPGHVQVVHVPFGTVLNADGRPMRTRHGDTPRLSDLVTAAVAKAREVVAAKNPDLAAASLAERARQVGIGAIKYADLSTSRGRDYRFDLDRMVSLTGDTGVYLQYAHARTRSILRRAGAAMGEATVPAGSAGETLPAAERRLVLLLDGFGDAVEQAVATWEPHRLCGHLSAVAQAFTAFYEICPVLTAADQARARRLALCRLTAETLSSGLDLLGIAAPGQL
jgi:arginyl-tRNA synthetase